MCKSYWYVCGTYDFDFLKSLTPFLPNLMAFNDWLMTVSCSIKYCLHCQELERTLELLKQELHSSGAFCLRTGSSSSHRCTFFSEDYVNTWKQTRIRVIKEVPGDLACSLISGEQAEKQVYVGSLHSCHWFYRWIIQCVNSVTHLLVSLSVIHFTPLRISKSCKLTLSGYPRGCRDNLCLIWFSSFLEQKHLAESLPHSWKEAAFTGFLLCTFGITSWKDSNGFLTLIVACESSILQTRCCIYLCIHTSLRCWEETQTLAQNPLPAPSPRCLSLYLKRECALGRGPCQREDSLQERKAPL